MAGNVAPIARVAGDSTRNVPAKATNHCHNGVGRAPVIASSQALTGAISTASATLHSARPASQAAYQRSGRALRSMRGPKTSAPAARPPKKAVTTASTAATSWPSHSAACCVQTIW